MPPPQLQIVSLNWVGLGTMGAIKWNVEVLNLEANMRGCTVFQHEVAPPSTAYDDHFLSDSVKCW